jgi:hypothetical protein
LTALEQPHSSQRRLEWATGFSKRKAWAAHRSPTHARADFTLGLARYASLRFRDRFNRELRGFDQFIKTAAGNWIPTSINHRTGFHTIATSEKPAATPPN